MLPIADQARVFRIRARKRRIVRLLPKQTKQQRPKPKRCPFQCQDGVIDMQDLVDDYNFVPCLCTACGHTDAAGRMQCRISLTHGGQFQKYFYGAQMCEDCAESDHNVVLRTLWSF